MSVAAAGLVLQAVLLRLTALQCVQGGRLEWSSPDAVGHLCIAVLACCEEGLKV